MAKLGYFIEYKKTVWFYLVMYLNIKFKFLGKKTVMRSCTSKAKNIVYDFEKELFI